jgi:uncharacterized repeat protein (TIGR03803 family)
MNVFRSAGYIAFLAVVLFGSTRSATGRTQIINTPGDAAGFHLSVYHIFKGGSVDGSSGTSALIRATDGNLYGTSKSGGAFNAGIVFRMTPTGTFTVMHSFSGPDGSSPRAALLQATDTNFYGTTFSGGSTDNGVVFRMALDGTFTVLHNFTDNPDGANPQAALIQAPNGNLFGTTRNGGMRGRGTIFAMTTSGALTVPYFFTGAADGAYPSAPLLLASDGNYYGTVYAGDSNTFGRVFRMSPAGVVTVMHTFTGSTVFPIDGGSPLATVVEATDGFLYGTTTLGGAANKGTLFRMSLGGVMAILKQFDNGADGGTPQDELVQGADGALYSECHVGGIGYGVLFRMALDGTFTVVHTFNGGGDGATPTSPLVQTPDGRFWGSTAFGGADGKGVIYRLSNVAPPAFTDNTITPGVTVVQAIHINELRSRIDAIRARFGLAPFSYTDSTLTPGVTVIKAVHITELRTALGDVYSAVALSKPTYTDSSLTGVVVKAVHINEVRAAVVDLE